MKSDNKNNTGPDEGLLREPLSRRTFMQLSALGAGALLLKPGAAQAAPKLRSAARIVIAGAGAAGLATASRLAARLEGATITLIDARKAH